MCMGDWRLGRLIRSVGRNLIVAGTGPTLVAANQQRVGITFCAFPNAGNTLTINVRKAGALVASLSDLGSINMLQHFTLMSHADLPTYEFTAVLAVAGNVDIIEYILTEEALRLLPKELESQWKY